MAHVHAALIQQFAKDALEYDDPGQFWEFSVDEGENWNGFNHCRNPSFNNSFLYRRKQETININGHNVPKPLRVDEIEYNVYYYMPFFVNETKKYLCLCSPFSSMKYYAKKGLLHKTEEAAIAHAEALLSFTEQKND